MVIAVIAVRVVQVRADEVIEMIAVRHGLVAAACPVHVRLLVIGARVARRARVGVLLADREHMLIAVVAVRMMQVSIVQVIDVVSVPQRLMSHQICVLSTHYEGMPLALLEGMAAGCAVVGSAVPGVREVLDDGVDGLLVPENDANALADALERVLRNPQDAARMAAAARKAALERHGRELMNRRYEELFLSLARGA